MVCVEVAIGPLGGPYRSQRLIPRLFQNISSTGNQPWGKDVLSTVSECRQPHSRSFVFRHQRHHRRKFPGLWMLSLRTLPREWSWRQCHGLFQRHRYRSWMLEVPVLQEILESHIHYVRDTRPAVMGDEQWSYQHVVRWVAKSGSHPGNEFGTHKVVYTTPRSLGPTVEKCYVVDPRRRRSMPSGNLGDVSRIV